jgi:hypothetical protein
MYAYKFRLLFDDVDDFVRDYEVLACQTFKAFHDVIVKSIKGLSQKELASFYICNRKWDKVREITLLDMSEQIEDRPDEEAGTQIVCMSEAVISEFIDDPHQRLIYEYDFIHTKTFYIELMETFLKDSRLKYPRCAYASKELPEEVKPLPEEEVFNIKDILSSEEDEDDEDYYDEDDLRELHDDIDI